MIQKKFLRFPGGKAKVFTLSYDDAVEQDCRLIDLLRQHQLKCTFNINSGLYAEEGTSFPTGTIHRRMSCSKCNECYRDEHCEIAVHGLSHPRLETLSTPTILYEITQDRRNLEGQFGCLVRGMAYPYGSYNKDVIDALRMSGIAYARSVHSTGDFRLPENWYEWAPTCHHNDERLPALTKDFLEKTVTDQPLLFYVWGHSYEFEAKDNWFVIENLCEEISGKDDVWYATNIEIYDYLTASRYLQFSVDGDRAHNPTATDIFLCCNGKDVMVPAGKTTSLR